MLSVVKMLLKGEVGVRAFNSHGNYIVHHGKSWKNHGSVFLNFCGNPEIQTPLRANMVSLCVDPDQLASSDFFFKNGNKVFKMFNP